MRELSDLDEKPRDYQRLKYHCVNDSSEALAAILLIIVFNNDFFLSLQCFLMNQLSMVQFFFSNLNHDD